MNWNTFGKAVVALELIGCAVLGIWVYGKSKYYEGRISMAEEMQQELDKRLAEFGISRKENEEIRFTDKDFNLDHEIQKMIEELKS